MTRTACVIEAASVDEVRTVAGSRSDIDIRANRLGVIVTGKPGDLAIDASAELERTVYDILYSDKTGWFAVTIYRGVAAPVRWDNRPGEDAGYPRVAEVLGATTPATILAALDVPPDAIGYAVT